jgi:hypothetical protein
MCTAIVPYDRLGADDFTALHRRTHEAVAGPGARSAGPRDRHWIRIPGRDSVHAGKEVDTIEIVPELGQSATERLRRLGYTNVQVGIGDGYLGWPEKAPFDRIILTAAPPEIPPVLIDQLKPGGRLVAPVGAGIQDLTVVDKAKNDKTTTRSVLPVQFVPMKGAASP